MRGKSGAATNCRSRNRRVRPPGRATGPPLAAPAPWESRRAICRERARRDLIRKFIPGAGASLFRISISPGHCLEHRGPDLAGARVAQTSRGTCLSALARLIVGLTGAAGSIRRSCATPRAFSRVVTPRLGVFIKDINKLQLYRPQIFRYRRLVKMEGTNYVGKRRGPRDACHKSREIIPFTGRDM